MPRRLPNLNQLRTFEAAARRLSFKDAADELHVTHAAVSHQIKALEADLGLQLFTRHPRRVELTNHARQFAARLSPVFSELAEATQALVSQQMLGELKITMAPYYATRTVLPFLGEFHARYPGLLVSPEMGLDVVDLRFSDYDCGLRYGEGDWVGLTSIKLYQERVGPVASPEYIKGKDLPMNPAEIAEMVLAQNKATTDEWPRWFRSAGVNSDVALNIVTYDNRAQSTDMALSGTGIALADRRLVAADIEAGRLAFLNPITIDSVRTMYVTFPETEYPDPRILAFADWLRERYDDGD